jgi:predicted ester cyclase
MKQPILKKFLLFVVLCPMLILGCKENPKEATIEETPAMTQISDAEFNALWVKVEALWEQGDPALINTVYADNFKRISPGGASTSAEELTNELNAVGVAFPGLSLNLERYDLCGNMASVHWSVSGDFTGEAAGLKGNGKPYKVPGITVLFVEDGKIVKDDSYWDTFAVFAQTGGYKIVEDGM